MDLNEIKNRAKDLLADLTEPRPERNDRRDENRVDENWVDGNQVDENRVDDPAARTDRLSGTMAAPGAERAETRPGDPAPAVDRRDEAVDSGSSAGQVTGSPSADYGDGADRRPGWDADQRPAGGLDEQVGSRPDTGYEDERVDPRPADGLRDEPAVLDERADRSAGTDYREGHLDAPSAPGRSAEDVEVQPAGGYRDEPIVEPAADFRDERVDRPAAAGMPEHRVLAETREPVQPGVPETVTATHPAVDPGPRDDGRHHLRDQRDHRDLADQDLADPDVADRDLADRDLADRDLGSRDVDSRGLDGRYQDDRGRDGRSAAGDGATVAAAAAGAGVSTRTETSTGDSERLVTAERAESYGSRWNDVKGEFVDEPRQAVAKADALVGELLDELAQLFADQRRGIEQDLDNNDASTEDLRVALRRYRSFFDRLLSV